MDGIDTLRPLCPWGHHCCCSVFCLPKDPPKQFPEGLHRAVLPASPYQGVDEGSDGVIDARKQEKQDGVAELLQEIPKAEGEKDQREEDNNVESFGLPLL